MPDTRGISQQKQGVNFKKPGVSVAYFLDQRNLEPRRVCLLRPWQLLRFPRAPLRPPEQIDWIWEGSRIGKPILTLENMLQVAAQVMQATPSSMGTASLPSVLRVKSVSKATEAEGEGKPCALLDSVWSTFSSSSGDIRKSALFLADRQPSQPSRLRKATSAKEPGTDAFAAPDS